MRDIQFGARPGAPLGVINPFADHGGLWERCPPSGAAPRPAARGYAARA